MSESRRWRSRARAGPDRSGDRNLTSGGDGEMMPWYQQPAEAVLELSTEVLTSGGPREVRHQELLEVGERMAADGLRVLAVGLRRWAVLPPSVSPELVERDLTLLGFVGTMDPPREEAREAVATCRTVGIVPVMITGDHALTARAIARRLGILDDDGAAVMTGPELAALSLEAFTEGSMNDFRRRPSSPQVRAGGFPARAGVPPQRLSRSVRHLSAAAATGSQSFTGLAKAPRGVATTEPLSQREQMIGTDVEGEGTGPGRWRAGALDGEHPAALEARGHFPGPADEHPRQA
jgi:hypothetical protein